jgi:hypothetical protein
MLYGVAGSRLRAKMPPLILALHPVAHNRRKSSQIMRFAHLSGREGDPKGGTMKGPVCTAEDRFGSTAMAAV